MTHGESNRVVLFCSRTTKTFSFNNKNEDYEDNEVDDSMSSKMVSRYLWYFKTTFAASTNSNPFLFEQFEIAKGKEDNLSLSLVVIYISRS